MGRKRKYFERLEERNLLAAGLIPIDLLIPLSSDGNTDGFALEGSVAVKLNAMVLDPKADDATDVSLTGYDFAGSGTFSGPIDGVNLVGSFATDPVESANNPDIPIQVDPLTQTIGFVLTQTGTFEARSGFIPIFGTFTIVAELTVDFNTREAVGQTTATFSAAGRVETAVTPVRIPNVIPAGVEFPDASKPFISGRIFSDANNNGTRQTTETGVAGIRATLLDSESVLETTELESIASDANGFYSFYNLANASRSIRFRDLPTMLDFGKMSAGNNPSIDSDADSRTGITQPLDLKTQPSRESIDVALRSTAFEWQNPNITTDVNNDRRTTASDALAIINLLSRLEAGATSLELPLNRNPGEEFFDVDRNGLANASDALAVIFSLYEESFLASGEQEHLDDIDRLATDRDKSNRERLPVTEPMTSLF